MDAYWDMAVDGAQAIRARINAQCGGKEPLQLILLAVGATAVVMTLLHWLTEEHPFTLRQRLLRWVFGCFRALPPVKRRIREEISKTANDVEDGFNKDLSEPIRYRTALPEKGLKAADVVEETRRYKKMNKADWSSGKVSGTVYNGNDDITDLMAKVFVDFAWTNPLHPDIFLDIRRMEAEVVRMCCSVFNGDKESCGTMTSGGTESIMLACRTYRDIAIDRGVKFPEILVPVTAHAAFDKSAQYLRMKIRHIPVDEKTRQVDVSAMRRAINRRTCMLVGSAPSFPHGIVDDLDSIQKLGLRYGLPVHVDCCLGGFLLPFMERAGFPMPTCDFRLPGVTSISCDTHKYGFAPKGSSVILYRNNSYRMRQIYVAPDWTGGIYATPTVPGSRPGVIVAQCWASLMYYGLEGYVESTRKIIEVSRYIRDRLRQQPHVKVYGDPQMSVIGIGSDTFSGFRLMDALIARGWSLNPLQFPTSFHLCCTLNHTKEGVADMFLQAVKEEVEEIMKNPVADWDGIGRVYGTSQAIPDRSMVGEAAASFIAALYTTRNPEQSQPVQNGVH